MAQALAFIKLKESSSGFTVRIMIAGICNIGASTTTYTVLGAPY